MKLGTRIISAKAFKPQLPSWDQNIEDSKPFETSLLQKVLSGSYQIILGRW